MFAIAYEVSWQTVQIVLPELLILLAATVMMTAGVFVRWPRSVWCVAAVGTLLAALVVLDAVGVRPVDIYSAVAINDAFSWWGRFGILVSGLILLALAHDQVDDGRAPEYFGAILMMEAGSMLVAAANELVFLFVGLELVSIPTYVLLYLARRNISTQEAATKYFYLSIFSSGLFVYGLALIYGLTGTSNLKALAFLIDNVPGVPQPQLALVAIVFVLAGLGFRVAAVPFHFYAPDVYQGSPTVLAALLSWIPKAVGFLAMIRTLTAVFVFATGGADAALAVGHRALIVAWILAAVTMTLGNTVALSQENLKRLLAYSSIAHAGYLMIGVAVGLAYAPRLSDGGVYLGSEGILFYLVAYALMTLGAFGVIIALSTPERPVETVDDLAGLAQSHPKTALAMALCLFSLAGIPPLAGFYGKFQIFTSAFAVPPGQSATLLRWLAVVGVINAAIGAYYYLRIIVMMYLRPARTPIAARPAWPTALAVAACAILSLVVGLYPAPVSRATRAAAAAALDHPDPTPDPVARIGVRG
jgi:NADH-quinone oxidoreductase subunit N